MLVIMCFSGSKAAVKIEDIVWGTHLCKAIRKMSTGFQTSTLESFHSVINHFAPKMTSYSYYGQLCRQHLAALHFNENIKREPRKSDNGNLKFKIVFPKFKTGDDYSVKILSTENTYLYVQTLLDTTLEMCGKKNSMETPIPPPLTSGKRKPSKAEAVTKLSSRYKKLKF
jgi:solute carrier family 8 (sodium/calcium exchanger)